MYLTKERVTELVRNLNTDRIADELVRHLNIDRIDELNIDRIDELVRNLNTDRIADELVRPRTERLNLVLRQFENLRVGSAYFQSNFISLL